MSRFSDDGWDDLDALLAGGRWMGRRKKVLEGRPGLASLKILEAALLALPHKRLIEGGLCDGTGVCANGAMLYRHFVDVLGLTPKAAWKRLRSEGKGRYDDFDSPSFELHRTVDLMTTYFEITPTMAEVIAYENDEDAGWVLWRSRETKESVTEVRYRNILQWVQRTIRNHPVTIKERRQAVGNDALS